MCVPAGTPALVCHPGPRAERHPGPRDGVHNPPPANHQAYNQPVLKNAWSQQPLAVATALPQSLTMKTHRIQSLPLFCLCLCLAISICTPNVNADNDPLQMQFTELAPGVWLGNRPDSTRLPVTPNTTFVISDEGVVVFDGGNLPLVAERVIAKIRSLTDQPVTHMVISHWHMDHVLGVARYLQAFPNVQVVAHPYTRELIFRYLAVNEQNMRNTVSDNRPGIESLLASDQAASLDARTVTWFKQFIEAADLLESQYRNFEPAYPNLTFSDALTIHSGQREIRLWHPGTGNTPGDLVMWLPEEKILASGDIVVWPTPYGHGGRAKEWAKTLRTLAAMDFETLIAGHGGVQTDRDYLKLMADTLESVSGQVATLSALGKTLEETQDAVDLSPYEPQFTQGDVFLQARFNEWFKQPIVEAAWKEANGEDPEIVQ
jgi:glyoxylase-like metal-dependent hydrolase (beta-lactamase superfamily II)